MLCCVKPKKHMCLTWPYYILWWMRLQVLSDSIIFLGCQKNAKKKITGQNSPFGPLNHHSLAGGNSFSYLQAQRIWRHLTHQVVGKDFDLSGKWKYAMSMHFIHMFMHIIYYILLYICIYSYIYIYTYISTKYKYIYIYYQYNIYTYVRIYIYMYIWKKLVSNSHAAIPRVLCRFTWPHLWRFVGLISWGVKSWNLPHEAPQWCERWFRFAPVTIVP